MYLKCPVFHVPTHSILCTCCQEDKVPLVEKKAKARTKWEESAAHIITVLMPPNANATIASFPCFTQITSIHFFQIIVQEMFVFCVFWSSFRWAKVRNPSGRFARKSGTHTMAPSSPVVTSSSSLSGRAVCPLCPEPLIVFRSAALWGSEIPLHPELRTIM